jgi:C4-dicarboxylate transporter DctQ subunit
MAEKRERESFETILTYITTAVLVVMLTVQVFSRYVLARNVTWSEEVSRISFVWMVYASIAYAAKHDKHIRLSFGLMALPPTLQKIILTVADAVWMAMNLLITYHSIFYIRRLFRYPFISQSLGINLVYTYFIVPIGFLFVTYRIAQNIVKRFQTTAIDVHDSRMDL